MTTRSYTVATCHEHSLYQWFSVVGTTCRKSVTVVNLVNKVITTCSILVTTTGNKLYFLSVETPRKFITDRMFCSNKFTWCFHKQKVLYVLSPYKNILQRTGNKLCEHILITAWQQPCLPGFVHVRKSQIQGLFKDIQGHVSANSRTKYWRKGVRNQ
jgi:hypothetical protein